MAASCSYKPASARRWKTRLLQISQRCVSALIHMDFYLLWQTWSHYFWITTMKRVKENLKDFAWVTVKGKPSTKAHERSLAVNVTEPNYTKAKRQYWTLQRELLCWPPVWSNVISKRPWGALTSPFLIYGTDTARL